MYVDEKYFLKRVRWHREALEFSHSMYYYLKQFFSESAIAREAVKGNRTTTVKGMVVHINHQLFCIRDKSILNSDVGTYQWALFRFMKKVERKLKKKHPNWDVEEALDARMNEHEKEIR